MRAVMPVPPPPPPPTAPPPPPPAPLQSESPKFQCSAGRGALLADIQKGTRLKKVTQVNDRSAPSFEKPKGNSVNGFGMGASTGGSSAPPTQGSTLSGLFAGGFPVLKPVGQRDKSLVSQTGSMANLKQPLWNLPSHGEGFHGSTPDLSPSHKHLERSSSLSKTRPLSSYTAPSSPSQVVPPNARPHFSAPIIFTPPPPPPSVFYQDRPGNRPPPLPTCPPPPPPPQISKPTWLPVQPLLIPMPTTAPPPLPPSLPTSALPDRFHYPPPPSPVLFDAKYCNSLLDLPPPSPPPLPASFTPSLPSSLPPPPKMPAVPLPTYRPTVPPLPPSYPCTAPSRRPPAIPRNTGAGRLAPPPAPPARSPTTELSSRTLPPPPLPPPPPPLPPAPRSSMRNGYLNSLDDFESKFQFHPVEDFPPPEEFRPFPRIYPSKENRGTLRLYTLYNTVLTAVLPPHTLA
ncbi:hypothetical protein P4O66_019652 [Electrophorus voltai]|uniref:WH2 domain-containing protein n=1 Tax=Electrophorus voltai TaxID=2609070 RepID=A0AAD8ZUX5_9TELE|nr:hypothetical protein P4O66_019652 [Electrophorus voltai]